MRTIYLYSLIRFNFILFLFFFISCSNKINDYSAGEKEWIQKNTGKIDVLLGYETPPGAFYDENGNYVGMTLDFLKEIESNSGMKFRIRNFETWDNVLQYSQNNNNFVIITIALTPQRLEYLSFTDAFVKNPYVIVTNVNSDIKNIQDLKDKKVCSPKGYAVNDFIANTYPFVKPEFVKNDLEGLRAVSMNLYDAMLISQMNASYISESQAISNIKIAGEVYYTNLLGAATSNKDEMLFKIIDKAVDKISEKDRKRIYQKWLTNHEKWIPRPTVIALLIVLGVIIIVVLGQWLWLKSLRKQVVKKTQKYAELNTELALSNEKFRQLAENSTTIIYKISLDPTFKFDYVNPIVERITGYTPEEHYADPDLGFKLVHPDDRYLLEEAKQKTKGEPIVMRWVTKDGRIIWTEQRNILITDENNIPVAIEGSAREITELKEYEINLEKQNREYAALNEVHLATIENLKATEQQLTASQAMLTAINNCLPFELFLADLEGNLLMQNKHSIDIWGDAKGKNIMNGNASEKGKKRWLENLNRIKNNQILDYEDELCFQGKTYFGHKIVAPYILGDKIEGVISLTMDITEKKILEQKILQNASYLDSIFSSIPLELWIVDSNDIVLHQSEFSISKWGDFRGRRANEFNFPVKFSSDASKLVEKVKAGDVVDCELTAEYQGEKRYSRRILSPVKDQFGENGYVSIAINLTELKVSEIQLKEKNEELEEKARRLAEEEQLFKNLFYGHTAIKLIIDPETQRIYDANDAAADFYGWSIAELKNKQITEINTLDKNRLEQKLAMVNSGNESRFEFKHKRANGQLTDVEVYANLVPIRGKNYIYSIIHDISEKKKFEQKSRLLSRAVEQSPISIVVTDKEGKIEYLNPAFVKYSGYSKEEALGQNPRILKSGQHLKDFYKVIWDTLLSGKTWTGELVNRRKSGELYWVNKAISPIFDENNEIVQFVSVSEDISEKRKMIDDLVVAKEKAEEANKLKTEFIHNMSHEVRTPMNGIMGFSEFLNDEDLTKEQRTKYVEIIQKSSQQLLHIIDEILEISRLDTKQVALNIEKFCLNTFVKELYSLSEGNSTNQQLEFDLDVEQLDQNLLVETDKAKLYSILNNLLSNAFKFTKQGFVKFGYRITTSDIEFFVKDSGVGISEKNLETIFNRFEQEEKDISLKYGGLGLGLSISQENAKLLNGKISVVSEKGVGSAFYLTIPNCTVDKIFSLQNSTVAEDLKKSKDKKTILVAEDEEFNFLYLNALLSKSSNFELIRALNGQAAVDLYDQNPNIDLILMDIKMPVMNGYEATKKIKSKNPDIPIIAVTAYSTPTDKQLALDSGCNDFVSKPFEKKMLLELIDTYL